MKYISLAVLISLGALSSVLYAASLEKEVARCAVIKGELSRLDCYDALARDRKLNGPQEKSPDIADKGKWNVLVKENPIDDSATVTLSLEADSGQSKWGRPVVLIARCLSNKTELFINWDNFLGRDVNVLTRVGDGEAVTKKWSVSTDRKATFHPSGTIPFLKQMIKANKLIAQVTPYNESPITAIFDIRGLDNAIKPLQETCHWQ